LTHARASVAEAILKLWLSIPKTFFGKGLAGRTLEVSLKMKRAIFIGETKIGY
jgi:hypothetical protein